MVGNDHGLPDHKWRPPIKDIPLPRIGSGTFAPPSGRDALPGGLRVALAFVGSKFLDDTINQALRG